MARQVQAMGAAAPPSTTCGVVLLAALATVGSAHPPGVAAQVDPQRSGSRLGIALVGIWLAPEGHGPFDNSLPCPARGVIRYAGTAAGREVVFAGCDLGDGVMVEGTGELVSAGGPCPPGGRVVTCLRGLRWSGRLDVRVDGEGATVSQIRIEDLALVRGGGARIPEDLGFDTGRAVDEEERTGPRALLGFTAPR